mgnify:FL=1
MIRIRKVDAKGKRISKPEDLEGLHPGDVRFFQNQAYVFRRKISDEPEFVSKSGVHIISYTLKKDSSRPELSNVYYPARDPQDYAESKLLLIKARQWEK